MDDNTEIPIVSALKSLKNVRWFLLQENINEQIRQLNSLERFVSGRKSRYYHI